MTYGDELVSGAVYELREPEQNSVRDLAERNIATAIGEKLPLYYCSLPFDPAAIVKFSNECDKVQFAVGNDGRPLLIGWRKDDGECQVVPLVP